MNVSFGKVYVQSSLRDNECRNLKQRAENLMLEGEDCRYRDKDYFVTEYDCLESSLFYPSVVNTRAYKVEAFKDNKKLGEKIYTKEKFLNYYTWEILSLKNN